MVEPELSFLEIEMEVRTWNASIMIEPGLGIGEETFDAVDVGPPAGVFFFAVGDLVVLAPEGEDAITAILVRIIDTASAGVLEDERKEGSPSPVGNRKGDHSAVSLIHSEYHPLPFRSPTPLASPLSSKEGLIELKLSSEGLHLLQGGVVYGLSYQSEKPLRGGEAAAKVEPGAVSRNTKAKKIEQMRYLVEGQPDPLQISSGEFSKRIPAAGASESVPLTPQLPLRAPGTDPPTTPSEPDKKSLTFWQARSQRNCLSSKHKTMISQSQFFRYYLYLYQDLADHGNHQEFPKPAIDLLIGPPAIGNRVYFGSGLCHGTENR